MRALLALLLLAGAPDPRDVSELLKPIRGKHDLPGLAALVVKGDGSIVAQGVDGVRKRGEKQPLTLGDQFHLGSCTKSMTATLIATLVDEGKLRWSSTVGEIFSDLEMDAGWKGVALEQLLAHRGGAPADLERDGLWAKLWTLGALKPSKQRRALVEGVLKHPPVAPPGTKYIYSNAGVSIAGAMAEKVTGQEWELLMYSRIFSPLGMRTAAFGAPGVAGKLDEPRGHGADGKPVEPGPGADNPAAIGPAGTACMSLGDWAKYVAVHLRFDANGTRQAAPGMEKFLKLVTPETLARLHRPVGEGEPRYALGWMVVERDWAGGTALGHSGSNTMWFVVAWLAPKKDFAVLVGINQGGDAAQRAADEAAGALIEDQLRK